MEVKVSLYADSVKIYQFKANDTIIKSIHKHILKCFTIDNMKKWIKCFTIDNMKKWIK